MKYRELGKTDLRVSEISLGCSGFWGNRYFSEKKAAKIINVEWNKGPNANISSESIRDYAISKIKDPDSGGAFVKEGDFYNSFKKSQIKHTVMETGYFSTNRYY